MSNLTDILTKSSCLSKTQLLNYLQQKLEREEEYLVESHLNDCELCNTALEGLMHTDLSVTETHLTELKKEFDKKLLDLTILDSKIKTEKKTPATNHQPKPELKLIAGKKLNYRWAYAASILLIVGLGYSVFSFIQKYNKKEVTHDINTKVSPSETTYNLDPNDSNNELAHLKVNPEDINQLDVKTQETTLGESKSAEKTITSTQVKKADAPLPTTTFTPPIVNKLNEVGKKEMDRIKEVAKPQTDAITENTRNIDPQVGMENYANEEADKRPAKIAFDEKTSSVGLKKKNSPANYAPSSNQMSYPAQNSNNEYRNDNNLQQEQTKSLKDEESSDLSNAIQNFNKGNYKKSIRQLERLLPSSKGTEREDIIYYLAMAYEKTGKSNQAEKYYAQLRTSTKYKRQANEIIQKMKK